MDNGAIQKTGLILCTHYFILKDIKHICNILNKNFNLNPVINSAGIGKDGIKQYIIKFPKSDIHNLKKIVSPYMCPSMMYKLV